jgi:hypothetical protein
MRSCGMTALRDNRRAGIYGATLLEFNAVLIESIEFPDL